MLSAALRVAGRRASAPWSRAAALSVGGALAACSVYTDELIDADASGIGSHAGTDDGLSGAGGSGGKSSATGGKASMTEAGSTASGTGAEGGAPNPDGMAGEGNGGSGAEAGTAGTAGTSAGTAGTAGGGSVASPLIDGFEDEDITLEQTSGRGGVWYLFDDGTTGKTGPDPLACSDVEDAPESLGDFALHITASGFTDWGSGLGADFRAGKKVYDASKYTGIRFWARVGEGKNTRHRLQLVDGTTDKLGGKCNAAANAPDGEKCEDHFGINLVFTSTWTEYTVPFADLSQIGWGLPADALDTATLYGLQVTAKAKLDVDLWLDQIEFF
jgi:hypothetical protein